MTCKIYSIIKGTGKYIPSTVVKNEKFLSHEFYDSYDKKNDKSNKEITQKFEEITTITERRHVSENLVTSDIAFFAAEDAILSSKTNKEELDYIIVAHNFGDIKHDNRKSDFVPSLAARVKHKLGIVNPNCVAYDLSFGCPGWVQAVIQADYYIKSGDAKRILVIGADVLSRISDPHDRDSMLYADGAGAVILEGKESETPIGILAHSSRSDTLEYSKMLYMDTSFNPDSKHGNNLFLKMNGRKLYQYALNTVPVAIQTCLEKSKTPLSQINKILIHQANGKMDDAILKRLYKLNNISDLPKNIMPMTVAWLGNSSVATVPTLLDLIMKNELEPHKINEGDSIIFASVGAGMNINAIVYKM